MERKGMRALGARKLGTLLSGLFLLSLGCAFDPSMNGAETLDAPEIFDADNDVRDTSQNAVVKISTLAQLRAMSGSGTYELANDINASSTLGTPFVPIGTQAAPFTGSFDGKTFKITNLTIAGDRNYAGMFGYASGATIKYVQLTNVRLTNGSAYAYSGGLVGYMTATNLSFNQVSGAIQGGASTGGLVGYATGGSYIGSNQSSSLSVSGGANVGGLVGYLTSSSYVASCSKTGGDVTGSAITGGLVGRSSSSIVSYSTASGLTVTGASDTGGVVGYASNGGLYYDSFSGQVQGGSRTGGLVGFVVDGTVLFSSALNTTVNGASETGGLVGSLTRSTVDTGSVSGAITGTTYTGGIVGKMGGSSAKRSIVTRSYIDDRAGNNQSTVQGGTPVGMAVGRADSYTDLTLSYAIGKVSGASTKVGGFVGEIYAPGMVAVGNEPRATVKQIFTKVEVSPTFDGTNNSVFAGGLVGYMLGADVENINVAGSVKGRVFVGGVMGYVVNTGANAAPSIVRSMQTRGEVTNVATANRSGVFGGAIGTFARCLGNYWDSTTDSGTAPPLDPGEGEGCQLGVTSTQLKSPVRQYLDADHPNGNFELFAYGGFIITRGLQQALMRHECEIGAGTDGEWGFGFCEGLIDSSPPLAWALNSSTEYNTLTNIPRPERQPKN